MYENSKRERICQGDIFVKFDLNFVQEEKKLITLTFPYVVVLTQDCDLEQDYKQRSKSESQNQGKHLHSILVSPMYLAEDVRSGSHLDKLGIKMETWSSDLWRNVTSNQNERFYYFKEDSNFGMPNLVVDFKHFYTVSRVDLYGSYGTHFHIRIKTPYRESLSQKYANYISRIGLPGQN